MVRTSSRIAELRDLAYRCRFGEVLQVLGDTPSDEHDSAVEALVANVLFETGQRRAATERLASAAERMNSADSAHATFLFGRYHYLASSLQESVAAFREAEASAAPGDHQLRLNSQIGLANGLLSLGQIPALETCLNGIAADLDAGDAPSRFSAAILFANYHQDVRSDGRAARGHLRKVIGEAQGRGWSYFVSRAMYAVACGAQACGDHETAQEVVALVRAYIGELDLEYLEGMMNERFGVVATVPDPLEVDERRCRVRIGATWIDMRGCPLLLRFFAELLYTPSGQSSQTLARTLWPSEPYSRYAHDPRLQDLSARIRQLLRKSGMSGIRLRSARDSYAFLFTSAAEPRP